MDNTTRDMIQEFYNTAVSLFEAAIANGADSVTFNRLTTMAEYAYDMATEIDLDTTGYDALVDMIVIDDEGIATFSSEYDEDAAWEAVDNAEDDNDDSDGTDTNSNFAAASTVNTSEISA